MCMVSYLRWEGGWVKEEESGGGGGRCEYIRGPQLQCDISVV